MLGPIIALISAVLFYRRAKSIGLPPTKWAIFGALSFWIPEVILSFLFLRLVSPINVDDLIATMVLVFIGSFSIAAFIARFVFNKYLKSAQNDISIESVQLPETDQAQDDGEGTT